ncbi:hypothetical protein DIPPA_01964, partial [Diplonema papillatum]
GKVLSPAEIAKVNALPEFEKKLAELESEDARAAELEAQQAAASGAASSSMPPSDRAKHSPGLEPSQAPRAQQAAGPGQQRPPALQMPWQGQPPPQQQQQHQQHPQHQQVAQLPAQQPTFSGAPPHIQELHAQIEAQRRELEEKQKHIEYLVQQQHQQGGSMAQLSQLYLSPGPPPLESPNNALPNAGVPMSPVSGLPPHVQ